MNDVFFLGWFLCRLSLSFNIDNVCNCLVFEQWMVSKYAILNFFSCLLSMIMTCLWQWFFWFFSSRYLFGNETTISDMKGISKKCIWAKWAQAASPEIQTLFANSGRFTHKRIQRIELATLPHLTSPHPSPTAQPTKPNQWELGTRKHYKTPCQPRCWHLISCLCLCLPPRLVSLHPTSTRRPHPSAWLWKRCLWIWKWENVRNFRNPSSLTLSLLPPHPQSTPYRQM